MSAGPKRRAAIVAPKRRTADDIFIDKIAASVPIYKHHPAFRHDVKRAKNLVMDYLRECRELYPNHWVDPVEIGSLEDHDRDSPTRSTTRGSRGAKLRIDHIRHFSGDPAIPDWLRHASSPLELTDLQIFQLTERYDVMFRRTGNTTEEVTMWLDDRGKRFAQR